jgi:hypothetical protein
LASPIGWQAILPDILAAGVATRISPPFDEGLRANKVAAMVADARKFPIWPIVIAVALFFVSPYGPILGGITLAVWGYLVYRAIQKSKELARDLERETQRLRVAGQEASSRLDAIVAMADAGDLSALQFLLRRWMEHRPHAIKEVAAELSASTKGVWNVTVTGVSRTSIAQTVPRVGRGRRTFQDKRKATDIDEDLTEINAAAVLSFLTALFSGPSERPVDVRLTIDNSATTEQIPWVMLATVVSDKTLTAATSTAGSAVGAIRQLGGNVGHCRNQRLTPATISRSDGVRPSTRKSGSSAVNQPFGDPAQPTAPIAQKSTVAPYPSRAATVHLGESMAGRGSRLESVSVPPIPERLRVTIAVSAIVSSTAGRTGEFANMAKKYVSIEGDESAPFAPFQTYWPTYGQMNRLQLAFYFKWRTQARRGEAPPTDLSYVFLHVYELLHVIGATNAGDASQQLERLWLAYRLIFPRLDNYIVRWTSDLYAKEVSESAALAFMRRAVAVGASPRGEELLLVTDSFWANADYLAMPSGTLSILTGDARLGDNKFYREHNSGPSGDSWVNRAYRQAMTVADDVYMKSNSTTPREAEIKRFGLQPLVREPFQGAVYDWKRALITLGKVPRLSERSEAVTLYRNSVRYAENLLRKERGFSGRLRGVAVAPDLARALDMQIASYIRSTKPRTKVTIDLAKAESLSRDSADVRTRLLDGLDAEDPDASEQAVSRMAVKPSATPAALLTDLPAVERALASISVTARMLLEALMNAGWELESDGTQVLAATNGALITPLVDEINESALSAVGVILIVHEGENLVVQDDFRDEVYWVLKGTLEGFGVPPLIGANVAQKHKSEDVSSADIRLTPPEVDGFGPVELQALAIMTESPGRPERTIDEFATELGLRPLLILDRVNEVALASPYGDIVLDIGASPPCVMPDAADYVHQILKQFQAAQAQASGELP